jgi:hypothetical protein
VQAEHAQPGQVDRGGQQVEVGGDLGKAADPHAAAAVAAADQMGELALHLGSGRAVVGGQVGVGLAGAGSGQLGLVGGDGDGAASRGAGALARSGHAVQAGPKLAWPWWRWRGSGLYTIGAVRLAGQVMVPAARSLWNWSLVKCPLGATGAWILTRGSMLAACRLASSGPVP